jgi:hypothetical protein
LALTKAGLHRDRTVASENSEAPVANDELERKEKQAGLLYFPLKMISRTVESKTIASSKKLMEQWKKTCGAIAG